MPQFDDEEQNKKVAALRQQEEEQLAELLSQKYKIGYIDLTRKSINTDALRLIEEERAKKAEVAAFDKVGKKLMVAVRTPNTDEVTEILEELKGRGYVLDVFMVSQQSLARAWDHYADLSFAVETKAGVLDISGEDVKGILRSIETLDDARNEITKVLQMKKAYRISRALEIILASAIANNASDIHIEPEETQVRLRFRLNGVLTDILDFDFETFNLLLSRIKLLSGLKINIKNTAQDGRFSITIDNKEIEIRTSILPGAYNESIVMRILNPDSIFVDLEKLGMQESLIKIVREEIQKPNGMILNTGPTGSGKTTTLYAILREVHQPEIKIITIEDPIEYHLKGIVQTQVDKDYTFATGLRSSLRQDPDIIMVGEIRDEDVAQTALHAALTGHLVFSTLHTNSAAGAIPRLIDLGLDPQILGSGLNLMMAQRLVRTLRPECKREVKLEGKQKEFIDSVLASFPDPSLIPENREVVWEPVESEECGDGYTTRVGVFEAIRMDSSIEKKVRENPSDRDIIEAAKPQGILNMTQDGVMKALNGVTSLSEIERVLDVSIT